MFNNHLLTWSPPSFYSNDIPQASIPTYHVYVKNQNGSVIVDINTTNTSYEFFNNFYVCDVYTVIVTVFIQQYKSFDACSTGEYSGSMLWQYY